jgi:hypothetical protein
MSMEINQKKEVLLQIVGNALFQTNKTEEQLNLLDLLNSFDEILGRQNFLIFNII